LSTVFLWLLLILIVILTDSNESIKEELSVIMKEHIKETKLLQQVTKKHMEETKLMKDEIVLLNKILGKKGK